MSIVRLPVWLVILTLAVPRGASAQHLRQRQIAAGYTSMSDVTDHVHFPLGWFAGGAVDLNTWLSAVVDVDGQYKTIAFIGHDISLTSHAVAGGIRASAQLGRFVEFGQLLAGVMRSRGTLFGSTERVTQPALQPGAGLDYPLTRRWAVRGEFDMRFIYNGPTGHEVRAVAGVVRSFD